MGRKSKPLEMNLLDGNPGKQRLPREFLYDNGSAGAEAYRQLTKEVLKRINK